jgi:hypothetical protein
MQFQASLVMVPGESSPVKLRIGIHTGCVGGAFLDLVVYYIIPSHYGGLYIFLGLGF